MIRLNGQEVALGSFPDGTLLIKQPIPPQPQHHISWFYQNDRELVALIYLVGHLKSHGYEDLHLTMPYIPNARQDRVKGGEDVFTLKYFSQVINALGFRTVRVLDPHSNVSEALIDRVIVEKPQPYIQQVIQTIRQATGQTPSMFYPDEGAGKRYSGMVSLPYAFGIKKRDWQTGKILGLDVAGDVDSIRGRDILIVDDICSRGGTFYFAARRLKELGAKNIYLYVTHCENTILEGDLLTCGLIKRVYTTNSLLTAHHALIETIQL